MNTVKNFVIILLSIATIIFAALFLTYYNNLDSYMKDKENELIQQSKDLEMRERAVVDCEKCKHDLSEYIKIFEAIKEKVNQGLNLK